MSHKKCERCNIIFECCATDITSCQCYDIKLSHKTKLLLENSYSNCLCAACLIKINDRISKI